MRRSRFDATGAPDQHGVPKRDLCKQERLEVGAAKWGRAEVSGRSFSPPHTEGGPACVLLRFLLRLY